MKRVCTHCGRISSDGNEWCTTRDCPSGTLTTIFDYGEFLGDIEILRLLRVFRMSALYEARRGKEQLLLKVAHDDCQEQIKREAVTLSELAGHQHPMLPVLLPPYPAGDAKQRPYGKTVFQDQTKYYIVLKYANGDFLRDILVKNPQPWYQHAAWLTISLADVIYFIHIKGGKVLLNLSPDNILVRADRDGILRPLLLDLGMASDPASINLGWVQEYGLPAYTAPELLEQSGQFGPAVDVYGLGLTLYEMLAGHPAYTFKLKSDEMVRQVVRKTAPAPLNRTDLSEDIAGIITQAIDRTPARRHPDVRTFAKLLRTKFGEVPAERKSRFKINYDRLMQIGIGLALIAVIGVALAAVLGPK